MATVKKVKKKIEVVVTTSLPGEERIFWPFKDVQFYIRVGEEKVGTTGNPQALQEILNFSEEPITTDYPDMEFWKYRNILYQLDNFNYVDESKLFDKDFSLNLPELLKKYPYQQTHDFENKPFWYLLKFLFIGSELQNLEGFGDLSGGIPKGIKIKCYCGELLEKRWILKGIFRFPDYNFKTEYYLRISEPCKRCETIVCIYRDRALDLENFFVPIRVFLNFLDPKWNYDMESVDMVVSWQKIFQQAALKDMEKIQKVYSEDLIKLGMFLQDMERKLK